MSAEHEAAVARMTPNDLGGGRRWGWTTNDPRGRNVLWAHRCTKYDPPRHMLGTIDVATPIHTLMAEEPLHIEPSILCLDCGEHGFIRNGEWVSA